MITLFKESTRIFLRRWNIAIQGTKRYKGTTKQILNQIINDCWNGKYFQTSSGHFSEFYTRDFGWCTKALINLGHKERVEKTLTYAIRKFKQAGKITTTISPEGTPFDFPKPASDSLPFFIHSLVILNNKKIIISNKVFLNQCINDYCNTIFDKKLGLVKKGLHLSSMKDHAIRSSSTYDNCMCLMLKNDLEKIKILNNPFKDINLEENIIQHLFNGTYFYNDITKEKVIFGDANIFPYFVGIDSPGITKKCITAIQENNLDKPFPLKYQNIHKTKEKRIWQSFFVTGYETNAIWWHMMPIYLSMVKAHDQEQYKQYLASTIRIIQKHKNYLEVYSPDGQPLKNFFYHSDEGMLWAAMLLCLIKDKDIL